MRDPTTSAEAPALPKPDRVVDPAWPSRVDHLQPLLRPGGKKRGSNGRPAAPGDRSSFSAAPGVPFATVMAGAGSVAAGTALKGRPQVASVDRVLVGGGAATAEARIRIADGQGGTAEIRLVAGGGRAIAAQILTAATGSRETLSEVMNEVRLRLQRRGIALTDLRGGGDPSRHRPRQDRGR